MHLLSCSLLLMHEQHWSQQHSVLSATKAWCRLLNWTPIKLVVLAVANIVDACAFAYITLMSL